MLSCKLGAIGDIRLALDDALLRPFKVIVPSNSTISFGKLSMGCGAEASGHSRGMQGVTKE